MSRKSSHLVRALVGLTLFFFGIGALQAGTPAVVKVLAGGVALIGAALTEPVATALLSRVIRSRSR